MEGRHKRVGQGFVPQIVLVWCLLLVAAYGAASYFLASTISSERAAAIQRHEDRLDPSSSEAGRTEPEPRLIDLGRAPENITVDAGIYVERIPEVSTRDSRWKVEFVIWFRWVGKEVRPGETFRVVDGVIIDKKLEVAFEEGEERYELYRVRAEITKFFNVARFPRDDHLMTIRIEDSARQFYDLAYVPDQTGSKVSSRVNIPDFKIYGSELVEKKHSYKTRLGDPRLPEDYKATYSQLIYGIRIERPGWGLYVKIFLGIFSSVFIAFLAFFISPDHAGSRITVGVGAFFAATASTYVISREIPQSNVMSLADFVTSASLITIFLTLLTSVLSVHIFTRLAKPAHSQRLDKMAQIAFVGGYVILNVAVASAASA